jgi:hypothetical protein
MIPYIPLLLAASAADETWEGTVMDIGSATAASQYSYQTTLQSSGQNAAVQQALATTYTAVEAATGPSSSDPLAGLAGASAVSSLVSGINTMNQASQAASGTQSNTIAGLQSATFGGLDSTSATSLLASLNASSSNSGLQGFGAAVAGATTLAIAAYQAQQAYPTTTPAAQTSPSSTPTTTVTDTSTQPTAVAPTTEANSPSATTQDQSSPAALQQAVQAALNPSIISMLA